MRITEASIALPTHAARVAIAGDGPSTILLLHGYTDSWRSFELVLPALAAHARCVAIDQRGHGASEYDGDDFSIGALAGDAAGVLRALGVARASVVGHSMGSFVARALTLEHRKLVDRLVLAASGPSARNEVVTALRREVLALPEPIPRAFADAFQESCLLRRSATPAPFFEHCVGVSERTSPRTWRRSLSALIDYDDAQLLRRIDRPTLVIGGEHDGVFSAGEQRELARAIPGATLRLLEVAGHSPHWEQPAEFTRHVLDFLAVHGATHAVAPQRTMSDA